ncbi:outer membrane scaffolding protein for murein synthesis (MipA/OmpV family) [Rhizobium sp. BK251]|nr:outer membrane scaffolding protein for murein synthesis (MipA/OmpV family) [Rhizobium sp. BK251]
MFCRLLAPLFAGVFLLSSGMARAQDGSPWWSGDWYFSLGAEAFVGPKFKGASRGDLQFAPLVSVGKQGSSPRFSSRNDSPSVALFDNGTVRAGIAGRFVPEQDGNTASELKGLKAVKWGAEIGGFVEAYPTDWLRGRAELRQGVRSHYGLVADLAVDAFTDIAPNLQLSGGPRATFASRDYFDTYYGVTTEEAAASGLSAYSPGGGIESVGVGGALTWQAMENLTASSFIEYKRLAGSAADSSLVTERGSPNQLTVGVSANYRFNFSTR